MSTFWQPTSSIDPSNPNNPLDSIGVLHNSALDYIAQMQNPSSIYETFDEFRDTICQRLASLAYSNGHCIDIKDAYLELKNTQTKPYSTIDSTVRDASISERTYSIKLNFLNYMLVDDIGRTKTIAFLVDTIRIIENNIINDNIYTVDEFSDIMEHFSVLRYSLVYWNEVDNGLNNLWVQAGYQAENESDFERLAQKTKSKAQYDAEWKKANGGGLDNKGYVAAAASWVAHTTAKGVDFIKKGIDKVGEWTGLW